MIDWPFFVEHTEHVEHAEHAEQAEHAEHVEHVKQTVLVLRSTNVSLQEFNTTHVWRQ